MENSICDLRENQLPLQILQASDASHACRSASCWMQVSNWAGSPSASDKHSVSCWGVNGTNGCSFLELRTKSTLFIGRWKVSGPLTFDSVQNLQGCSQGMLDFYYWLLPTFSPRRPSGLTEGPSIGLKFLHTGASPRHDQLPSICTTAEHKECWRRLTTQAEVPGRNLAAHCCLLAKDLWVHECVLHTY